MARTNKYHAFICYSRADTRWAVAIQKHLERFRIPKSLRSKPNAIQSLCPIFRDQTELTSGDLGQVIDEALASSSALIVICSPAATKSRWVNQEIRRFKQIHGSKRIYPLIVSGEPQAADPNNECFPESLFERIDENGDATGDDIEPFASNIQELGGKVDAFLRITAAILDVGFDQLKQREQKRRQVQYATVSAGALLVASITTFLAIRANIAQQEAEFRREQADDLISFMVGDLRDKLEPIGRVDVLDDVGDMAMNYFASLPIDMDSSIMSERAMTLRQIGEVRVAQGQFEEGLRAFNEAMEVYERLVSEGPSRPDDLFNMAQTHFWIADAHFLKLEYEEAEREIVNYRNVSKILADSHPDNSDYLLELAMAESNLGTLSYRRSEFEAAKERFEAAVNAARRIVAADPDAELYASTLSTAISWLGSTNIALGDTEGGIKLHREMVEIGRSITESSEDMREREIYARDLQVLSKGLHSIGEHEQAMALDREAVEIFSNLVAFDRENNGWLGGLSFANLLAARHKLTACSFDGVADQLNSAAHDLEQLIAIDPASVYARIDLHSVGVEQARLAAIKGDLEEAAELLIQHRSGLQREFEEATNEITLRQEYLRATALLAVLGIQGASVSDLGKYVAELEADFSKEARLDAVSKEWIEIINHVVNEQDAPQADRNSSYFSLVPDCGQY